MNIKTFEQFDVMTDAELAKVEGGGMEWIGDVLGAIGNAAHPVNPRQVVDQLNGSIHVVVLFVLALLEEHLMLVDNLSVEISK